MEEERENVKLPAKVEIKQPPTGPPQKKKLTQGSNKMTNFESPEMQKQVTKPKQSAPVAV